VSGQGTEAEMAEFVADYDMDGFEHVADSFGQVWTAFGVSAQPSYVFLNDDGTIRRHVGGLEPHELAEELALLAAS